MEINGGYLEKSLGDNLKPTMAEQQAFNATMSNVTINGKTLRQAIWSSGHGLMLLSTCQRAV